jgi:ATP-dependent helicase/DNAse subunit B
MHSPYNDYVRSLRQVRKARRRGDAAAADRWTKIAERDLRMANRLAEMKEPFLKPLWTPTMTQEDEKAEIGEKLDRLLRQMEVMAVESSGAQTRDGPAD